MRPELDCSLFITDIFRALSAQRAARRLGLPMQTCSKRQTGQRSNLIHEKQRQSCQNGSGVMMRSNTPRTTMKRLLTRSERVYQPKRKLPTHRTIQVGINTSRGPSKTSWTTRETTEKLTWGKANGSRLCLNDGSKQKARHRILTHGCSVFSRMLCSYNNLQWPLALSS